MTFDRNGNCQIYVNNSASGSPIALTAGNANNSQNFYLGRAEGVAFGNIKMRNGLFAKKVWTQAERDKIWTAWKWITENAQPEDTGNYLRGVDGNLILDSNGNPIDIIGS